MQPCCNTQRAESVSDVEPFEHSDTMFEPRLQSRACNVVLFLLIQGQFYTNHVSSNAQFHVYSDRDWSVWGFPFFFLSGGNKAAAVSARCVQQTMRVSWYVVRWLERKRVKSVVLFFFHFLSTFCPTSQSSSLNLCNNITILENNDDANDDYYQYYQYELLLL